MQLQRSPALRLYCLLPIYTLEYHIVASLNIMYMARDKNISSYFCYIIRKSKDYVYGIWVYKALDIWKCYYRVKKSLVSYVKPWTEARNNKYMKYHSKLTYQLSFWNVSRKVDYHAGGKWFIHGPKRRKENQLLSLKQVIFTTCMIQFVRQKNAIPLKCWKIPGHSVYQGLRRHVVSLPTLSRYTSISTDRLRK